MWIFFIIFREDKLQKEHDIALTRLNDWKKRFLQRIVETQKQVSDMRHKDRMSEATNYVTLIEEISKRVDEFLDEVFLLTCLTCLYKL